MLLADLPEEILCLIFDHLSPGTDLSLENDSSGDLKRKSNKYGDYSQNILNLILCSHLFHKLGMPCLYRSFHPLSKQSWLPFIRATLAQPDLAQYTKTLNFSMKPYSHFAHSFLLNPWPKDKIPWTDIQQDEKAMAKCMNSRTIGYETQTTDITDSPQPDLEPDNSNTLLVDALTNNSVAEPPLPLAQKEMRGFQKLRAMAKWRKKQSIAEPPPSPVRRPRTPLTATQVIVYKSRSGNSKSTAIYLIYRLPNLESISLTLEPDTYLADRPFQPIPTLDPSLIDIPRLHSFTLNHTKTYLNSSKVNVYFPLLLQSSIRSFSTSNLIERDWHPTPRDVKLPLTHLSIFKGNLCNNSIDSWFQCCPQLLSFTYQQEHMWGRPSFSPGRLAISLRCLSQTLRQLTIHRSELSVGCLPVDRLEFSNFGPVLRTFEVLSSLDITTHLLLGPQENPKSQWWIQSQKHTEFPPQLLTECLPQSLKSLILRDCAESILDESKELALCDMPLLKDINLHFLLRKVVLEGTGKLSWEEEIVGKVSIRSCRRISKSVRFEE